MFQQPNEYVLIALAALVLAIIVIARLRRPSIRRESDADPEDRGVSPGPWRRNIGPPIPDEEEPAVPSGSAFATDPTYDESVATPKWQSQMPIQMDAGIDLESSDGVDLLPRDSGVNLSEPDDAGLDLEPPRSVHDLLKGIPVNGDRTFLYLPDEQEDEDLQASQRDGS